MKKTAEMDRTIRKQKSEIAQYKKDIKGYKRDIKGYKKAIKDYKKDMKYYKNDYVRLPYVFRNLRSGYRCLRQHGFHYTWNQLFQKIQNKLKIT